LSQLIVLLHGRCSLPMAAAVVLTIFMLSSSIPSFRVRTGCERASYKRGKVIFFQIFLSFPQSTQWAIPRNRVRNFEVDVTREETPRKFLRVPVFLWLLVPPPVPRSWKSAFPAGNVIRIETMLIFFRSHDRERERESDLVLLPRAASNFMASRYRLALFIISDSLNRNDLASCRLRHF